jgi:hypothetical protein
VLQRLVDVDRKEARMAQAARLFRVLLIVSGLAALVIGVGLWAGTFAALVTWHMRLGAVAVISLWVLAGLAWRRTRKPMPSIFAILWGAGVLALGITQARLLPGSMHWIVQVVHLLTAGIALGLGRRLVAGKS